MHGGNGAADMGTKVELNISEYIKYRPDIEGMRAIAVISVLLFHMGLTAVPGGFVGVDVFFVISGFLITQDIHNRVSTGRFDILEFYLRRVRRIFPSLFVVLFFSTIAAAIILLPTELEKYGKSVIGASLSFANIVFYKADNYFGAASEETPLLHTWSLGVEEQFYLFWPLVIIVSAKVFGRLGVKLILVAIVVGSLTLSQVLLASDPTFSFYMLPARAWELALGGFLGLCGTFGFRLPKLAGAAFTLLGILLIGYAIFVFSRSTPFPGFYALVPCAGAALIIYGGQIDNPASRLICNSTMRYVGRISYPLYLVHWPIIVFSALASPAEVSLVMKLFQIVAMFIAADVLYRFVEPMFRKVPATRFKIRFWAPAAAVPTAVAIMVGLLMLASHGWPSRRPMPIWVTEARSEYINFQKNPCLMRGATLATSSNCEIGDPERKPTLVLWGDSQATQLIPAFRRVAEAGGYSALIVTKAGCAPIHNVTMLPSSEMRSTCKKFNEAALARIEAIPHLKAVILSGAWKTYVSGQAFLTDGSSPRSVANSRSILRARVASLSGRLDAKGAKLIVMGIAPTGANRAFSCASRAAYRGIDPAPCSDGIYQDAVQNEKILFDALGSDKAAAFVSYLPAICSNGTHCGVTYGDKYNLLDNNHISVRAATALAPRIAEKIDSHPDARSKTN